MPFSYHEVGALSPGNTLVVPFEYLSREHINVLVDGVPTENWSWINNSLIHIDEGFPTGTVTRVQRTTPADERETTLQGASVFDWDGVNANDLQLLFILQETEDAEAGRQAQIDDIQNTLDGQLGDVQEALEEAQEAATTATAKEAAQTAASQAQLYDGPKIDTFAELANVTPSQVPVGGYLRCVSIGAVYQRVSNSSTTAAFDYTPFGGCKWIYIPDAAVWDARAFGMDRNEPDNAERLEYIELAIWNYYNIPSSQQTASLPVIEFGGGEYVYRRQVNLGTPARRGLIFKGGMHYCDQSETWGATDVLFNSTRTFTQFLYMTINPRQKAGAILYAARNRIEGCIITGFGWCGIWQKGGTPGRGTTHIVNCEIGKYDQTWTSAWIPGYIWPEEPAILIEGNDTEITNCQIRWSMPNIKVSSTGGFMTIHGGHIYCGRAGHGVESYNLVVEPGAKACRLVGVYIDGGYCDIYNNAVDFIGCGACIETTAQTLEAFIRIYATGAAQQTMGCQIIGFRRLVDIIPIVNFKPYNGNDWNDGWKAWSNYINA